MAMPPTRTAPHPNHRGFMQHVSVFVVIVALLAALNFYLGKPYWVIWVLLGWGAGLGLHALLARRHH